MKLKNILAIVAISASTAILSVWGYGKFMQRNYAGLQNGGLPANYSSFAGYNAPGNGAVDFTPAATAATPAVVHIKTKTKAKQVSNNIRQTNPFGDMFGGDMFGDFFGGPRMNIIPEQQASGSGVLITEDGYIVTNNHVVNGADEINVTLTNKKSYKATLVGTDISSDLAVLKIEGKAFPFLAFGNSDDAKLGQWVLAIGYPLNLDVTVTAGIVSAKARSININKGASPIESFIQTDAAVNQGNSGGALINTNGELIGINSAIASQTGGYIGYSYAIPVNIVKKIANDIVKFGTVQRAFIGITYASESKMTDEEKKELGIKEGEGVYVTDVPNGGSAAEAGIKKADIITKINGVPVSAAPEMVEQVSRYKPGDKITVTYKRNGKEATANLTLKNKAGNTDVVKTDGILDKLGAELENADKKIAAANDIAGGVIIKKINGGALAKSKMQEGYIITSVNGVEIKNIDELTIALKSTTNGKVRVEGIYPGYEGVYPYTFDLAAGE